MVRKGVRSVGPIRPLVVASTARAEAINFLLLRYALLPRSNSRDDPSQHFPLPEHQVVRDFRGKLDTGNDAVTMIAQQVADACGINTADTSLRPQTIGGVNGVQEYPMAKVQMYIHGFQSGDIEVAIGDIGHDATLGAIVGTDMLGPMLSAGYSITRR